MKITAIKTHKIIPGKKNIFEILDKYITELSNSSIVAVTSKIVSICEGQVVKIQNSSKINLIQKEAAYFIPPEESKFNITLTIKRNLLVPTAGIDESNGNGYYILWPKNPQKSANEIRKHFLNKFKLKKLGVIITDSRTAPLRWGTTGLAISYSGFTPLNNYIGKPDIFGRPLHVTKANIMDALAASAVLLMGEGNEQTPLAIIEDLPFVRFTKNNPTQDEVKELKIKLEDDLYYPLLKNVHWKKGKGK